VREEAFPDYLRVLSRAPLREFSRWEQHRADVPTTAWGVYTVWAHVEGEERLMYVGMGGTSSRREDGAGLLSRLSSHASGQRSGNRFCIYVCDRLVLRTLSDEDIAEIAAGRLSLDSRTREVIRSKFGFRLVSVPDARTALDLEKAIKRGVLGELPYLQNPHRIEPGRHGR
jgi:hypothetical protein